MIDTIKASFHELCKNKYFQFFTIGFLSVHNPLALFSVPAAGIFDAFLENIFIYLAEAITGESAEQVLRQLFSEMHYSVHIITFSIIALSLWLEFYKKIPSITVPFMWKKVILNVVTFRKIAIHLAVMLMIIDFDLAPRILLIFFSSILYTALWWAEERYNTVSTWKRYGIYFIMYICIPFVVMAWMDNIIDDKILGEHGFSAIVCAIMSYLIYEAKKAHPKKITKQDSTTLSGDSV